MLQIFIPQASPHTSRQRQSGHSEQATIDHLLMFTEQVNTQQVPDVNHNLEQKQLSKPQAQDPKKIDFKETDPKQTTPRTGNTN